MLSDIYSGMQLLLLAKKGLFIALSIVGIGMIIAIHEFGHFIFGKLFKVNIPSFSIGFGPKIFSRYMGQTQFSLSLIPVGGYVEAETGSYDNPTPGTIAYLPYWKKLVIIGGGIIFNLIFSYLVFTVLLIQGLPQNPFMPSSKGFFIASLQKDSAADRAHLCKHDRILQIDGQVIDNKLPVLLEYIQAHPNTPVTLTIQRENNVLEVPVTLGSKPDGKTEIGALGVEFNFEKSEPVPFFESIYKGFDLTLTIFKNIFSSFTKSIQNKDLKRFVSPLMVIKISADSASQGMEFFFFLLAYISIGLAVLNIIPLPILDGGQALTSTIEAIIRRPIGERLLNYIHLGCWILMLGLYVLLTYQDILRIFWQQ